MNQFLNQYGLTYTGTTEQTNLTTFCIWSKKVNNFNTCFQNLYYRTLIFKCRRIAMDNPFLSIVFDFVSVINRFTKHIEQTSKCLISNRNADTCSCCSYFHIFMKSFTCSQHQAAHFIVSKMLCNFHNADFTIIFYLQSIFDARKISIFK